MIQYQPNWNAIFGPSVQAANNQAVASQATYDRGARRRQGFRDFFGNLRQNAFNAFHPNLAALGNTFQGATVTPYQPPAPNTAGFMGGQGPVKDDSLFNRPAPAAPPYFNGGLGTAWGQIPTSQRNQFLPALNSQGRRTYTPPQRVY